MDFRLMLVALMLEGSLPLESSWIFETLRLHLGDVPAQVAGSRHYRGPTSSKNRLLVEWLEICLSINSELAMSF